MRRIIVNADDFGLTRGINRAILEAYHAQTVTSATLMAGGAEFEEAVSLARTVPGLSVGCHVVLVGGRPLLPVREVSSLVTRQGTFRAKWTDFASAALTCRLDAREIEAEATAQIRHLQDAGLKVTHVDTHKHVHIFPQVLRPILRAAQACGVRAVRNPFEAVPFGLLGSEFRLWQRWCAVGLLNVFAQGFQRGIRDGGITSPDGSLGVVATGRPAIRTLRYMIEHLPEGTWELVCHPGYDDAQLRGMPTTLLQSRQAELQILTSTSLLELLAKNDIQLISYHHLLCI